MTISRQFSLAAALISISIVLIVSTLSFHLSSSITLQSIKEPLERDVSFATLSLQQKIESISSEVATLSSNLMVVNALIDSKGRETYIVPFIKSYSLRENIPFTMTLCDFEGSPIVSNSGSKTLSAERVKIISGMLDKRTPHAEIIRGDKKISLFIVYPVIYFATDRPEGFLALEVDLKDMLERSIINRSDSRSNITIRNGEKIIWARSGTSSNSLMKASRRLSLRPPFDKLALSMEIDEDIDSALASLNELAFYHIKIGAVILAISVALSYYAGRRLSRRLVALNRTANLLKQKGWMDVKIDDKGFDEVANLAAAFKSMLARLRESHDELEIRVSERTAELSRVNDLLSMEIDERTRAEGALRESEALYRGFFDSARDGVSIVSENLEPLDFNDATLELLGYDTREELAALPVASHFIVPEDINVGLARLNRDGYIQDYPLQIKRRDGTIIDVLITGIVLRNDNGTIKAIMTSIKDVTERRKADEQRRKLESQLLQAQKMEAVGQLAGGIAHDINNILSAITGYTYLLQIKMAQDDPLQSDLSQILTAAGRGAEVTHSLLAFSRKQVINPLPWNVNTLIRKSMGLMSRLIGEDIEIVLDLCDKDLICLVDAAHMDQVLLNMATNARDAMPKGGRFALTTSTVILDQSFINSYGYGKPGPYASITVSDTGSGLDRETLAKIFEPFFTTKATGRGTGLGLAMVYGIIQQMDGFIDVVSEPQKGTTFHIYLPLTEMKECFVRSRKEAAAARGKETILVAEDDESVRSLFHAVLANHGYDVIMAADGDEAIKQIFKNADSIRLIMIDMIMPKKSGIEVYDEIRKAGFNLPFLFISGYTADRIDGYILNQEGVYFLAKPVSLPDLLAKVREILDAI